MDFYTTDSVKALRDVELAVDHEVLSKLRPGARRPPISTRPRLSLRPNPFMDIAQRLSTRRIRPLVLELVQALGHYLDALWNLTHSDGPIPWIDEGSLQWRSKVIAAVQEGKRLGYVADPPTQEDVSFWAEEVGHALRDVDDAVGIFKGVGWAFEGALTEGEYGDVTALREISDDCAAARLLSDLEEALWLVEPSRLY